MSEQDTFTTVSLAQLEQEAAEQEYRLTLDPRLAAHPHGFLRDEENAGFDIWWGGYPYWVEDEQISTPEQLLWKLHHLMKKDWENMTPLRASRFIGAVAGKRGWTFYGDNSQKDASA